jgi:hypothetical protein
MVVLENLGVIPVPPHQHFAQLGQPLLDSFWLARLVDLIDLAAQVSN